MLMYECGGFKTMNETETVELELDPLTEKILNFCVEWKTKQQGLKE